MFSTRNITQLARPNALLVEFVHRLPGQLTQVPAEVLVVLTHEWRVLEVIVDLLNPHRRVRELMDNDANPQIGWGIPHDGHQRVWPPLAILAPTRLALVVKAMTDSQQALLSFTYAVLSSELGDGRSQGKYVVVDNYSDGPIGSVISVNGDDEVCNHRFSSANF